MKKTVDGVVDKQFAEAEGKEDGKEKKDKKRVKVKASGGIKGLADWKQMIGAGAERVGTSSGVGIVREVCGEGMK